MSKMNELKQTMLEIEQDKDEAIARITEAEEQISNLMSLIKSMIDEELNDTDEVDGNPEQTEENPSGTKFFDTYEDFLAHQVELENVRNNPREDDDTGPEDIPEEEIHPPIHNSVSLAREEALIAVFGSFVHANSVNPEQLRALSELVYASKDIK